MVTKTTATKKKQTKKKAPATPPKNCFVIMPFGGWEDDYYTRIYLAAIESAGLKPHRADDLFRPSTIINDIWEFTKNADIILAVLTGRNPNVLYELGLAHAIGKPAILVTETMDDVPFDLRSLRIIEYDKNVPDWGDALKNSIEQSIKEVVKSPLKSVLPTFLEIDETQKSEPISTHEKEILELRNDVDLLKRSLSTKPRKSFGYYNETEIVSAMVKKLESGLAAFDIYYDYIGFGLSPIELATLLEKAIDKAGLSSRNSIRIKKD